MLRSLFAGVSGLQTHQVRMDTLGANISNVNTFGFKRSRATFKELVSQNIAGATAPDANRGGTNPVQVGLGVQIGNVAQIFQQGNLQFTGANTDMAVEGGGFFTLKSGQTTRLTRAGAFSIDANGTLVDPASGYRVQGWLADSAGVVTPNTVTTDIMIPVGSAISARSTTAVSYGLNIDSDSAVADTVPVTSSVFDSLGALHAITLTMTKTADNTWTYAASSSEAGVTATGTGTITFDPATGAVATGGTGALTVALPGGLPDLAISMDFAQVTQFASVDSLSALSQNGFDTGQLEQFTVDNAGIITGSYSNGRILTIGQLAMSSVTNPAGLNREGGNYYSESPNSGLIQVGVAGVAGRGRVLSGTLEASNVDLSQEFTALITTQRGYQANARVVTTSDEMLQELLNLKR